MRDDREQQAELDADPIRVERGPRDVTAGDWPRDVDQVGGVGAMRDAQAILEQLGAESVLARVEGRLETIEQDLERALQRQRGTDRARQGELDVMRARIEDAAGLVRETLAEQRDAWLRIEQRFDEQLAGADLRYRQGVDQLREDLVPRAEQTAARVEELQAGLRAELTAFATETDRRLSAIGEHFGEVRGALSTTIERLRGDLALETRERAGVVESLQQALAGLHREQENDRAAYRRHTDQRAEELRRELDAASGELRATLRLSAAAIDERIAQAEQDIARRVQEADEASSSATQQLMQQLTEADRRLLKALEEERAARIAARDDTEARIAGLASILDDVQGRVGTEEARFHAANERTARDLGEVRARLDDVQVRLPDAINRLGGELGQRVAELSGQLDAVRDSATDHGQRLASLARLERQVGELVEQRDRALEMGSTYGDPRVDAFEDQLAATRHDVASLTTSLRGVSERAASLAERFHLDDDHLLAQRMLRQEVRDLAATTSELTRRLADTERLSRATGKALSALLRTRGGVSSNAADHGVEIDLT